jgi:hypothetical protein
VRGPSLNIVPILKRLVFVEFQEQARLDAEIRKEPTML